MNKDKVKEFINSHSEEELQELFIKGGVDPNVFEKPELSYDELPNKEALQKLYDEMYEYATYLRESTYHPYDKIEKFSSILKKIINRMWPYEM